MSCTQPVPAPRRLRRYEISTLRGSSLLRDRHARDVVSIKPPLMRFLATDKGLHQSLPPLQAQPGDLYVHSKKQSGTKRCQHLHHLDLPAMPKSSQKVSSKKTLGR